MGTTLSGDLVVRKARFALVASRFNEFIVSKLIEGAKDAIVRHGGSDKDITLIWVPGGFELPLVAMKAARDDRFDAVVCLGAIIRGSTPHFDYVASEAAKGIAQAGLQTGKPVTFGVLTTDTIEQAVERAGTKAGNKGCDAAMAAIELINLYSQW